MGSEFSFWNNRVIRKPYRRNQVKFYRYDVHEVHYNKKGKPVWWTDKPIYLNAFDTIGDLRNTLAQILRDVLRLPVLEIKSGKLVERKRRGA